MAYQPLPMRGPIPAPRPDQSSKGLLGGFSSMFADSPLSDPMTRLMMGAQMMSGQTLQESMGGAMSVLSQSGLQRREDKKAEAKKNQTLDWLQSNAPEYFDAVQAGVMTPAEAWGETQKAKRPAKVDYQEVGGQLYNPSTGEWIAPPANPNAPQKVDTSLQGIPMQDANGNWVMGQLNSKGELNPAKAPDGYSVASPYDKSAAIAGGKLDGAATAALPQQKALKDDITNQIDAVLIDPALDGAVGPMQGRIPSFTGASIGFDQRIKQLQGGAFLQARQMLKGGGQITDYEGQKAEQAIARLSQAQTEDDFKLALSDFRQAVNDGYAKLEAQYGGGQVMQGGGQMQSAPSSNFKSKYGLE
jgi:hypothetical protein